MIANTSTRMWVLGAGLLTVAIAAMGWFLGISPKLDEAGVADQQRAGVVAQNVVHEREVAKIKKQYEQLPQLKSELAVLRAAVPANDDLSTFLGELHALEQQSQVSLTNFTASDGQPYTPVKSTEKAVTTGKTTSTSKTGGTVNAPITTNPLVTPENFVAITVNVTVTGDQPRVMNFIEGVQTGGRLYLVTDLTLAQDQTTGAFKATITGFVYVLLDANASTAAPDKPAETTTAPKG